MRRREFITLVGGAAATWPRVASAQQAQIPLVGFLGAVSKAEGQRFFAGFHEGMREFGYIQGRNYLFEDRYAHDDPAMLPLLLGELIGNNPATIVTSSMAAAVAAKKATATIPIVGASLTDPVSAGLAMSEARPGGNVTGILTRVDGLPGKQLELSRDVIPAVAKIGLLVNANNPSNVIQRRDIETASMKAGLILIPIEVWTPADISLAIETFRREGADIVIVFGDAMFLTHRREIAALASAGRLPTIYSFREHVEDGGLISYGIDLRQNFRRAAYFVDRILKSEKPGDLPIEFPTKLELVINLSTAKALGVAIPPTLLARADEVIE
jgi:putative tryptophan/tyrosine transport system substrate-binding protein